MADLTVEEKETIFKVYNDHRMRYPHMPQAASVRYTCNYMKISRGTVFNVIQDNNKHESILKGMNKRGGRPKIEVNEICRRSIHEIIQLLKKKGERLTIPKLFAEIKEHPDIPKMCMRTFKNVLREMNISVVTPEVMYAGPFYRRPCNNSVIQKKENIIEMYTAHRLQNPGMPEAASVRFTSNALGINSRTVADVLSGKENRRRRTMVKQQNSRQYLSYETKIKLMKIVNDLFELYVPMVETIHLKANDDPTIPKMTERTLREFLRNTNYDDVVRKTFKYNIGEHTEKPPQVTYNEPQELVKIKVEEESSDYADVSDGTTSSVQATNASKDCAMQESNLLTNIEIKTEPEDDGYPDCTVKVNQERSFGFKSTNFAGSGSQVFGFNSQGYPVAIKEEPDTTGYGDNKTNETLQFFNKQIKKEPIDLWYPDGQKDGVMRGCSINNVVKQEMTDDNEGSSRKGLDVVPSGVDNLSLPKEILNNIYMDTPNLFEGLGSRIHSLSEYQGCSERDIAFSRLEESFHGDEDDRFMEKSVSRILDIATHPLFD